MEEAIRVKAITIKQPWAWLIINAGKDIENRTWNTNYRGRILIHASMRLKRIEYEQCVLWVQKRFPSITIPRLEALQKGGIVGEAVMTGCVPASDSPWFTGPYGFVLTDPKPLRFQRCQGSLMIWEFGLLKDT